MIRMMKKLARDSLFQAVSAPCADTTVFTETITNNFIDYHTLELIICEENSILQHWDHI